MQDAVNYARLLHQTSITLQQFMGFDVVLSAPVVIKDSSRSLVVRSQVQTAQAGISSVIIKQIKEDAAHGFSDWASLAFLSELTEARGIVPRFYGGDRPNRLFLMEDLGDGESLHDLLNGSDQTSAHAALLTLATQMARLHAVTLEKQDLYERIRAVLPEADGLGRQSEAKCWLDNHEKLLNWFKALDCIPPAGLEVCLRRIAHVYTHADAFLGFTHGDPAPTNNHFSQGQAHVVDFEYGGFRHVLYDITAWDVLCPLPIDCVHDMRHSFRAELAKTCPAARDEALFAQAWADLCAYRAVAILTWISPDVIRRNHPWAHTWTAREAVLAAVSRLERVAAPFAQLKAVSEAAGILTKALHSRWPELGSAEDVLPQWPALKN